MVQLISGVSKVKRNDIAADAVGLAALDESIAWALLGKTTLGGAAAAISVTGLAAASKLYFIADYVHTASVAAGITLNGDTGANYSGRWSCLAGSYVSGTSGGNSADLHSGSGTSGSLSFGIINNKAAQAKKWFHGTADNSARSWVGSGFWNETANLISRIDLVSASNFTAGDTLSVWGCNP